MDETTQYIVVISGVALVFGFYKICGWILDWEPQDWRPLRAIGAILKALKKLAGESFGMLVAFVIFFIYHLILFRLFAGHWPF